MQPGSKTILYTKRTQKNGKGMEQYLQIADNKFKKNSEPIISYPVVLSFNRKVK